MTPAFERPQYPYDENEITRRTFKQEQETITPEQLEALIPQTGNVNELVTLLERTPIVYESLARTITGQEQAQAIRDLQEALQMEPNAIHNNKKYVARWLSQLTSQQGIRQKVIQLLGIPEDVVSKQ